MSRKFFLFFLSSFSFSLAFGNDDPERFLKENKLEGSFFLKEIATGREYVVNPEDVDLPTLPASTFKIVNSLIGIETGVVKDPSDLFPWDGVQRPIKAWNQDLPSPRPSRSLRSLSTRSWPGGSVRRGWRGTSPSLGMERGSRGDRSVLAPRRLWCHPEGAGGVPDPPLPGEAPLAERTQNLVKGMILLGEREGVRFSGKTGTMVFQDQSRIGWLVGMGREG